jgi:hypothetical protein
VIYKKKAMSTEAGSRASDVKTLIDIGEKLMCNHLLVLRIKSSGLFRFRIKFDPMNFLRYIVGTLHWG